MLSVLLSVTATHANAQSGYPERPVRIIVNFATGGPSDIVARMISAKLTESWGKPVVVENVAGGGGNIGVERAVKATPDGYTLLLSGSSPIVINPSLLDKPAFDPVRDLAPVTLICTIPNLLVIHAALPAKSVEEFVTLAKSKPGQFTFASSGSGTATHLGGELFKTRAGLDIRHIPYKGTGLMIPDLVAGRVTMTVAAVATFLPLVRDGRLRAIAVASEKRTPALPDLPTVAEAGYPGFDTSSWQGAWVPAKTPTTRVRKLNQDFRALIALPDMRVRFTELGMETAGTTELELARLIQSDLVKWAKVIKSSGVKIE
ncbi:MAG: tripartite tricarboxylate transporter substrate binding protein [Burkholderiales bacterium]